MTRFLYIFILIGAAAFYLLFADNLSFILLIALLILPVIMLLQLIISALFLRCSVKAEQITAFRGEPCEIAFRITNNSVFPLCGARLRIRSVCHPSETVKITNVVVPVPALQTSTVTLGFGSEHCSRVDITVENIKLYDLLRLFSARVCKRRLHCSLFVIPKLREHYMDEARELAARSADSAYTDSDNFRERGNGIPGDVCGFRDFLPGDRLSLMHYKLSARFDRDIVKILSVNGAARFLLTADLSSDSPDERDGVLERLMSVAYYLCGENAEVYIAAPSGKDTFGLPVLSGTGNEELFAIKLCSGSDYFAAAKALCGANIPAAENHRDFICCDLSQN
ncbi:MAG: DUF58 domain-containing protein [Oscillospiraceae bacterium]|nr:DUF58 domain-containing protein [Oscillospiraceae bacterium]